ncbi:MAG: CBS domain-containing protein [Candidatus Brocadiaceae bacterium]|nr:CBS domain-containing protein [Candidatus Brocadiaceae bacterium]
MKVKDIMSTDPAIVPVSGTFLDVIEMLDKIRYHVMLVVDKDEKLTGIITEADLLKVLMPKYLHAGDALFSVMEVDSFEKRCLSCKDVAIRDLMSKPIASAVVTEEDSIIKAASGMLDNRIHAVPVLRDGKVVGIISRLILLRYMTRIIHKK